MRTATRLAAGLLALPFVVAAVPNMAIADDHRTSVNPEASVYIISPADGQTVSSPFLVQFGMSGMGVAPAGVEKEGTGHHHLLINTTYDNFDENIPADDNHRHFGGGQTEAVIDLPPGQHTLQLLAADHNHVPHNPPVTSSVITITVE
jgi:hypothetical protein